jgi:hypothetical protein
MLPPLALVVERLRYGPINSPSAPNAASTPDRAVVIFDNENGLAAGGRRELTG